MGLGEYSTPEETGMVPEPGRVVACSLNLVDGSSCVCACGGGRTGILSVADVSLRRIGRCKALFDARVTLRSCAHSTLRIVTAASA